MKEVKVETAARDEQEFNKESSGRLTPDHTSREGRKARALQGTAKGGVSKLMATRGTGHSLSLLLPARCHGWSALPVLSENISAHANCLNRNTGHVR